MKIILSRKGFDSSYGGQPSPILPDGTFLSLPIPSRNDEIKFTDIYFKGKNYYDIIHELKPSSKIQEKYFCHLDPDIYPDIISRPKNWHGVFGQKDAAQTHLENHNVGQGDLFLFFGWFKETELIGNILKYKKDARDIHAIYGYLEIGEKVYTRDGFPDIFSKHPHCKNNYGLNNCLYISTKKSTFFKNVPGAGSFNCTSNHILTKDGFSRSKWDLPSFFRDIQITYHSPNSFKENYFDSAKKGQEFVIYPNDDIINWAKKLGG